MGRTRTQLRQLTVQQLGLPLVTGTSGTGTTSTLVDAPDLARFRDDYFIGAWVYLSSGTPNFSHLQVTDSVQTSSTLTFIPTLSAAPDALTYEVLPFPADAIHSAIDEALLMLYDTGILTRRVWIPAVTGSPIYNASMDYWTSSTQLHGWSGVAHSRQQGAALHWTTENATRLTANGSLDLDATWRRWLTDFAGQEVRVYSWIQTSTATNGRVALVEESGTVTNSTQHGGDGNWELREAKLTLPVGDLNWFPRLTRASANVDFGEVWVESGIFPAEHPFPAQLLTEGPESVLIGPLNTDITNLRAYVRPRNMREWPYWDWYTYHDEAQDVEVGVLVWKRKPPSGYRMMLMGSAPFTLPITDGAIVEVDQMESLLVAKLAALKLLEKNMAGSPASLRQSWAETAGRLTRDIATLSGGRGQRAGGTSLGPNW